MQRMRGDWPELEGPQLTMRSPRWTLRLMSRSTWNSPYHLLTAASSMMTSDGSALAAGAAVLAVLIGDRSSSTAHALLELALQTLAVFRHEEAEAEIDQRVEYVDLPAGRLPGSRTRTSR